ncbi:hypothetical protein [Novosphingobium sp. RL4]|uniref:hypothetical protein n=1 Tax=Novosphingobium sp. RL4 TaxID=3109595 RepID=UPI002D7846B3|nr:hypothetical protein [Novosphingobium sp. RL4]WRT94302.1 hypothetical protein U9J33_07330 [Novosphingobium sp. RL4]
MATANRSRSLGDAAAFFAAVRQVTGTLTQAQVNILNLMLVAAGGAAWPIGWLAYGLATAWHEARFLPQAEWGLGKGRPYAAAGKYGQPQYGRGLVQLTWDFNYEWADKALGLNGLLLRDFDLALDPAIATRILIKGMQDGAFTGRRLGQYIVARGTSEAFINARRIINGTDKAQLIAGYAERFQAALDKGRWA